MLEVMRLTALCVLIFLTGRAGVELCVRYAGDSADAPPVLRDVNYVALGIGATIVLLFTWLLNVVHLFSYPAIVAVLILFVVATIAFNPRFRAFVTRPWREFDAIFVAYVAGVFGFLLSLDVNSYGLRTATGLYVQQGWQLYQGTPPGFFPNFGVSLIAPLFYTGHLVSAVFGLLGHQDHRAYYLAGSYWVNALIAPVIPIGAYLFFKRFLSLVPALVVAAAFCTMTLGTKVWSLRGESIGWIMSFAFLIALIDVVSSRRALRLSPMIALLFFGLILTHGIAVMVALIAVAYVGAYLVIHHKRVDIESIVRFGILCAGIVVVLLGAFTLSYAHTRTFERPVRASAGALDAATEFDNAWYDTPPWIAPRYVIAHPPYVLPATMTGIAAFLPPMTLFQRGYDDLTLPDFPDLGIDELRALPNALKVAFPALLLVCCLLYLTPIARHSQRGCRDLFFISVLLYVSIIAVALWSDFRSVALYPVAAVRRSFPYAEFFFWLAIGVAVFDFLSWPVTQLVRIPWPRAARALAARAPQVLVACFVFGWFFYSQNAWAGRTSIGAMLEHVPDGLFAMIDPLKPSTPVSQAQAPMLDAMEFIRRHTRPGEWISTNVISADDTFSYLSDGRYSLTEGSAIYQLFSVLRADAARMWSFAEFARSADPALISTYHVRYVMLFAKPTCGYVQCYGSQELATNFAWFERSPAFKEVFSNGYYRIYRLTGRPAPPEAGRVVRLLPQCETETGNPQRRDAACTQLLGMIGNADPHVYYFRAVARSAEHEYALAIADFDRALILQPQNDRAYYERALTYAARGDLSAALSDIGSAENYTSDLSLLLAERGKLEARLRTDADRR